MASPRVLHLETPVKPSPAPGPAQSPGGLVYAAATRGSSAGFPRTPSQLTVERVDYPERVNTVFGQPVPRLPTRGERPGLSTPRHLVSSVGDVIFGGSDWAPSSSPTPTSPHSTPSAQTPPAVQPGQPGYVFGALPPTRPTVGSRAHLSRAHLHTSSSCATAGPLPVPPA